MNLVPFNPKDLPAPVGGYSQAVEISGHKNVLFISGQIAETLAGHVPVGFEEQCVMIWGHILNLLKAANMTIENVVKINTYLTNQGQAEINRTVRNRFLGSHRPALTVIVVQTLDTRWLLEIEAVAAK